MYITDCELVELGDSMFAGDNNNLQNLIIENIDNLNLNHHSLTFQNRGTVILLNVKKIRFR